MVSIWLAVPVQLAWVPIGGMAAWLFLWGDPGTSAVKFVLYIASPSLLAIASGSLSMLIGRGGRFRGNPVVAILVAAAWLIILTMMARQG